MLTLSHAALNSLADLVYDWIGDKGSRKGPGGEYDSIRLFLKEIGLAPPTAAISREHWGTRDANVSTTKRWLLSYLTELNSRKLAESIFRQRSSRSSSPCSLRLTCATTLRRCLTAYSTHLE